MVWTRTRAPTATVAAERPDNLRITETQERILAALCRPSRSASTFATPATNQSIAAEVHLSVDAVKAHLRTLSSRFGLVDLPQNVKRARLAELALQLGLINVKDLG